MKEKKIISGTTIAKIVSKVGILVTLVAIACQEFFNFAEDHSKSFFVLLCVCLVAYTNITESEIKKLREEKK